jgi:hypothetical protein
MGMSNYPNGFTNGVTIRGVPIQLMHPGKVVWVNNSTVLADGAIAGSDGNKGDYLHPFSTVDYAIGRCLANRGDVIMVMPNHAETLTGATFIASDVAGVALVGLGSGAKKPTFTWSAVASTWDVTAANCTFYNLNFISSMTTTFTTTGFSLSAAADGTSFEQCFFTDTSTTAGFVTMVTAASGVNDLSFVNCESIQLMVASGAFFTGVAGDRFIMDKCYISTTGDQTSIVGQVLTTGNLTNVWIKDSSFVNLQDGAISIDLQGTACSGTITNCYFSSLDIAGAITAAVNFTGGHCFECYVAGEADAWGLLGGGAGAIYNNA